MARQQPVETAQDFDSIMKGGDIKVPLLPCAVEGVVPFAGTALPFRRHQVIRIEDKPNPSSINIAEVRGRVKKVTVTLNGRRHPHAHDLDVLLVGPQRRPR